MYISWDQKYAPKSLDDYLFQDEHVKNKILGYVKNGNIPNMALYGHRGTGKSTLVKLLKKELNVEDADYYVIEGGQKGNISEIRDKLLKHIQTMSVGDFKLVFIEEADLMSTDAVKSLKNIINTTEFPNARFILAYNHDKKISNEVKSRLTEFHFNKFDKDEIALHLTKIMKKEGVKIKSEEELDNLYKYINFYYPDIRKMLLTIEEKVTDGKLCDFDDVIDIDTLTFIGKVFNAIEDNNWVSYREDFTTLNTEEFDKLYKELEESLPELEGLDTSSLAYKKAVIILNEHMINNSNGYADPFLNFSACVCRIMIEVNHGD